MITEVTVRVCEATGPGRDKANAREQKWDRVASEAIDGSPLPGFDRGY